MSPDKILYLSRKDVEETKLSMQEIIAVLDLAFREKGEGKVEMPPKPGIHTRPDAFIHAMPAYIPSLGSAGIKWVSGYPDNQKKNLPYISGLLILNDPETGLPISVMDCTWITAKRTGAATAVAAKYLARKESSTLGVIACGVQGRSNLEALSCIFRLTRVKAYDIRPEVVRKFSGEMSRSLGIEIEAVKSVEETVKDLDLVVTSGPILKNPSPAIEAGWLSRGAFACSLDFDSYWKGEAMSEADKIATDDIAQMDYYRHDGYFRDTPVPYADLGEIAAGIRPGRESADERILAINLGLALCDMAVAVQVYEKAVQNGIGTYLPF